MRPVAVMNGEKEKGVKKKRGHDEKGTTEERAQAVKRSWISPELIEYGNIVKLTEGGTQSTAADHGANMMRV